MLSVTNYVSLKSYTSWNIGGEAEFFIAPKSVEEVQESVLYARDKKLNITILGGGSNVLISDDGIRGLVICLRNLSELKLNSAPEKENNYLFACSCLAGTAKSEMLKVFLKYKLSPAEFVAGLPGDVGGGVAMNAGVGESLTPREFVELVESIDVVSLNEHNFAKLIHYKNQDLQWGYRHCEGWKPGVIVRANLRWQSSEAEQNRNQNILDRVRLANQNRLKKQPLDLPSCGSVFVNPANDKAGRLIEAAGLKGYRIGGAQVSEKHANFIVNLGDAKAKDVKAVILHVQKTVKDMFSIQMKTEVVFLGFDL